MAYVRQIVGSVRNRSASLTIPQKIHVTIIEWFGFKPWSHQRSPQRPVFQRKRLVTTNVTTFKRCGPSDATTELQFHVTVGMAR